jgi:hypothetical protein
VEYAIDGMVGCALYDDTVVCTLERGTVVCALDYAVFLLFFLGVNFLDTLCTVKLSAVVGNMIQRSLTLLPVKVIDGDDMEHWPSANVDVYPAVSN